MPKLHLPTASGSMTAEGPQLPRAGALVAAPGWLAGWPAAAPQASNLASVAAAINLKDHMLPLSNAFRMPSGASS